MIKLLVLYISNEQKCFCLLGSGRSIFMNSLLPERERNERIFGGFPGLCVLPL